jgi:hypothetical protein
VRLAAILAAVALSTGLSSLLAAETRPAPLAAPTNFRAVQWGTKTYLLWQDNSTSESGHMIQQYHNDSLDPESGTMTWSWKTIVILPANSTAYSSDINSTCGKYRVVAYRVYTVNGEWKMEQKASSSIEVQCAGPDH